MRNILFKTVRNAVYGFPVALLLGMLYTVVWKSTLEALVILAGLSFILFNWDLKGESEI